MKLTIQPNNNLLYNLLQSDLLHLTYNNTILDSQQTSFESYIIICLNYEDSTIYEYFKYYNLDNDITSPIIEYKNCTFKLYNNKYFIFDITATFINNFKIITLDENHKYKNYIRYINKDQPQTYHKLNTYQISDNFNVFNTLSSTDTYLSSKVNVKTCEIFSNNKFSYNDKELFIYINIPTEIEHVSIYQNIPNSLEYYHLIDCTTYDNDIIYVYNPLNSITTIDGTEIELIFKFYINVNDLKYYINTNNIYNNTYHVNTKTNNNVIIHNNQYTLTLYEKINDVIIENDDILYLWKNNTITYVAKVINTDVNNNNIVLENI